MEKLSESGLEMLNQYAHLDRNVIEILKKTQEVKKIIEKLEEQSSYWKRRCEILLNTNLDKVDVTDWKSLNNTLESYKVRELDPPSMLKRAVGRSPLENTIDAVKVILSLS